MSEHGLCCVECHASGTRQGENAGAAVESERIIKLLEERIIPSGNPDVHSLDSLHNLMLNNLIALIKGENK